MCQNNWVFPWGIKEKERKKNIVTEFLIFTKRNAEWIMDHRPKCRTHKYKTPNIGDKIEVTFGLVMTFRYNIENFFHERKKLITQTLLKLKTSWLFAIFFPGI